MIDLHWLTAPDREVAAAMATVRQGSRPAWVPTRRQVLVHVNHSLILWYLCVVFLVFGVSVDSYHDGQATPADIGGLAVTMTIFAAWLYGTWWLHRWAARPPSPRARMKEWRQTLTALANGFEPQPSPRATFEALITAGGRGVREYPRYVASGVEFGNLVNRSNRRTTWHYLALRLSAPLPHLILDATSNGGIGSDLPAGVARAQKLSLEGGFDRWFTVYAPTAYRLDALYVLTPDVMAALVDHAQQFNIEIVDRTLVFFSSTAADFSRSEAWLAVDALLGNVGRRILTSSARYRDERVPGQEISPLISRIRAELEHPDTPWIARPSRIGPDGRRLSVVDRRTGPWAVAGSVGWFAVLTLLYAVPGIFAFAGFMSIIDGR